MPRPVIIIPILLAVVIAAATLTGGSVRADRRGAILSAHPAQADRPLEIAVIVNKSNPNDSFTLAELRGYFLAERNRWPNGAGKVRIAMLESGQREREAALRLIYGMNEKVFDSYFLSKKFRGEILEGPREETSTADMIKFISYVSGAIGYVRADEVDASVKVVRVDGASPGEPGYKLKL